MDLPGAVSGEALADVDLDSADAASADAGAAVSALDLGGAAGAGRIGDLIGAGHIGIWDTAGAIQDGDTLILTGMVTGARMPILPILAMATITGNTTIILGATTAT